MDEGWSRYFINLLESAGICSQLALLPSLPWGGECKRSAIISLRKLKGRKAEGGGWRREERGVIWLSGGSIWFRGFSVHPGWLLADWFLSLFQTDDKLPYPPFIHLSISTTTTTTTPSFIHTLNLVRRIIEGANNEGAWRGVGEEKEGGVVGGVSSDPQKTLSNKTGTLRGWQWSGLLFSVLRHWWGKIREFLNTAKKGKKGEHCFERFRPQIQTLPLPTIDYSLCVLKGGLK